MRIVFMGSSEFSCPSLDSLLADTATDVVGVVAQPDRPKGRSLKTTACAVSAHLKDVGISIMTPSNVNDDESIAAIAALSPDIVVVVAYGQILRSRILEMPPLGCVNVHASILPKYRGAAPIQWAIANGDRTTGVTVMYMDEQMDAGDILLQKEVGIAATETGGGLHDLLSVLGAEALSEAVKGIVNGSLVRMKQDDADVTFAPKLSKKDGRINWECDALEIDNRVRAFNPWPCCFCRLDDGRGMLRIWRSGVAEGSGRPGEVIELSSSGPIIAAGSGAVRLLEVQPEGRKRMKGSACVCGRAMQVGDVLL